MRRLPLTIALLLGLAGCPHDEQPSSNSAVDTGAHDAGLDSSARSDGDAFRDGGELDARTSPDATTETDSGVDEPPIRTIPADCTGQAPNGGTPWTGWGNLQFPLAVEVETGEVTEPIYGQAWQEGATDQPGQAPGWEAQLVVGPLGAHPVEQPDCFRTVDAQFNADVGDNDEWWIRLQPDRAGVFGVFYRYRPPGAAWLYGDSNGSDDGTQAARAGVLAVDDPMGPSEIRVVTLNLRCRTDDWDRRYSLVVDALEAIDPHVIGFQEDCASASGGTPQSYEIQRELAARLDRGYEAFRLVTHQANHPEGTFDEGISMLTSFPIDQHYPVDLPYENFPRQASVMDVRLGGGKLLRLVNTHFDYGGSADDVRTQSAARVIEELDDHPLILTGDFNATPDSSAIQMLASELDDAWATARPTEDGFTTPAEAPTRRIDYVFTSGVSIESAALVDATDGALHLSDHRGVAVTTTPQ